MSERRSQTGNPAHLALVLSALKAQRDLLALDAPNRQWRSAHYH